MKINSTQEIGQAIRQKRKSLRITQKELAMTAGTGLRFVIDLEKGKPTCQLEKILDVVHALGIEVELMGVMEES